MSSLRRLGWCSEPAVSSGRDRSCVDVGCGGDLAIAGIGCDRRGAWLLGGCAGRRPIPLIYPDSCATCHQIDREFQLAVAAVEIECPKDD
jgi:hypothetical protein